ncbi:MAG: SUMF1/EgtB/PvdO family nonheme iron enzyme [Ignavibacteria bacterium]|nr:SUMF1/EgtB/PvdO family nonheme iron enzyme [Ignavibacteria bacterium]
MKKIFSLLIILTLSIGMKLNSEKSFVNLIGMKMIKIDRGNFVMGDLSGKGQFDEYPTRNVKISNDFYISETEVTVEQYRQFKKEYKGFESYSPYATGVTWYDTEEFCKWLSAKEGKPYRLPTEAEWEYVCRAGTNSDFSSGDKRPDHETPNQFGIKNMHTGPLEWCFDWYGDYPFVDQTNPIGLSWGFSKVVRGGLPDNKLKVYDYPNEYYSRSSNRSSMAPSFNSFINNENNKNRERTIEGYDQFMPGLVGIIFDDKEMQKPVAISRLNELNSDRVNWQNLDDFTAMWTGQIASPFTGDVTISVEVDAGVRLRIDGKTIIDGFELQSDKSGEFFFQAGKRYQIEVDYIKLKGRQSFMRFYWSVDGKPKELIPADALTCTTNNNIEIESRFSSMLIARLNSASIGFRVVQAPIPESKPIQVEPPFNMQGVKQNFDKSNFKKINKPYFRKRFLLPIPPENVDKDVRNAAGIDPYFSRHNHDPGMMALPNGDLLYIFYTSTYEDEPEVALAATRLRFGADEWDWPTRFLDFADVNDVAPLCWNDNGNLWLFFGDIHLDGRYPFQWINSTDNGASWSGVNYPEILNEFGPHTPQPVNSAFRDENNTIYFGMDGLGPSSLLVASTDNGKTWFDTGGRTGGRHTTFIQLKSGEIIGYGGKQSDINGYMPISFSYDKGKTWELSPSKFPTLGTNQRPTIMRLSSGKLFFSSDFQRSDGFQPPDIKERGAFVALSDDEGKSWHIKKIPGAQEHESETRRKEMKGETLGYSVAAQTPDGMIHLMASMTHPCLHFEFNEEWILDLSDTILAEIDMMKSKTKNIDDVKHYKEFYKNGKLKIEYSGGFGNDGRFLLHDKETWYYMNGSKQYEVNYNMGRKIGIESYWNMSGLKLWEWNHQENGFSKWTQWWPNGVKRSESKWKNLRCEGKARVWDSKGKLISDSVFANGELTK